jgi:hypothetical protein
MFPKVPNKLTGSNLVLILAWILNCTVHLITVPVKYSFIFVLLQEAKAWDFFSLVLQNASILIYGNCLFAATY